MKVRSSIKKIDKDDQIVKRRGRLYVINKKKPRNKQRQGWFLYPFTLDFWNFSVNSIWIFGLVFKIFLIFIFKSISIPYFFINHIWAILLVSRIAIWTGRFTTLFPIWWSCYYFFVPWKIKSTASSNFCDFMIKRHNMIYFMFFPSFILFIYRCFVYCPRQFISFFWK